MRKHNKLAMAEEDRMSLIQAALAEKEQEALEAIKEDICEWLATLLSLEISGRTFMEGLDTGVVLCQLVKVIQKSANSRPEGGKEGGEKNPSLKMPMSPLSCNPKADRASFFARDNVANFIGWCRKLGMKEEWVFESNGLVEHKDEKRVILCLLDLSRYADRVGISPPQLVQMEREIDAIEREIVSSGSSDLASEEAEEEGEAEEEEKEGEAEEEEKEASSTSVEKSPEREGTQERVCEREGVGESIRGDDKEKASDRDLAPPRPKKRKMEQISEPQRKKRKREESVDDKVMHRLQQCTCKERHKIRKCGRGKFIIEKHNRKTTLYARLLSDRVMVRVGGGWDSLDHFLLKHDPCRIHSIAVNPPSPSSPGTPPAPVIGGQKITDPSLLGKHSRSREH